MASITMSICSTNLCPHGNAVVAVRTERSCSVAFESSFFGSKFPRKSGFAVSVERTRRVRPEVVDTSVSSRVMASSHSFDVIVIGAGIIGLTIARQFLIGSDLSVAVVDKAVPCSGATGAGQGYIWMMNKTPGSDAWDLTLRSHKLWVTLAESISKQGLDAEQVLGWRKTGSLLVGKTPEESIIVQRRVKQLSEVGLRVEYLSGSDLLLKEPAVLVGNDTSAAFLPDDCQLDAHRTVSYIEKANRHFVQKSRYAEFYHDPVTCFLRCGSSGGEVEAVQTSKNVLYCKKAIVIATGCWTGSLMHDLHKDSSIMVDVPVKPRKGHLLVLENFDSLNLNHGLMEVGYCDHQTATLGHTTSASAHVEQGQMLSVSMTATMDTVGNLILGSSRQFAGFSTEVDEYIIDHIWKRAGDFFPKLREQSLKDLFRSRKVRVGLRPYMPDGKPVIGSVPGLSNVYLATGHEGGGLSMALGTAEMVANMVLGNPQHVNSAPFAIRAAGIKRNFPEQAQRCWTLVSMVWSTLLLFNCNISYKKKYSVYRQIRRKCVLLICFTWLRDRVEACLQVGGRSLQESHVMRLKQKMRTENIASSR